MSSSYQSISNTVSQQKFIGERLVNVPAGFIEFPIWEIEQSIIDRFQKQVRQYPQAIAIKTHNQTLSYQQLNDNSNRLATSIISQGNKSEVIVILLEKGTDFITSILGVLKTGKIFVPLDPTFPIDRLAYIIADSQAIACITNNRNLELAKKLCNNKCEIFNIDNLDGYDFRNPDINIAPEAPAYIIYTSGSTGKPKGVLHSHRNSLHYCMNDTNTLLISHEDRVVFLYSCSTLGGILCIFYTLLNGASLYSFDVKEQGLTNLANWLIEAEITIYHSFTTLFRHFVDTLTGAENFPNIRLVKLGGEATLIKDVEKYKKYFYSDCILYASLGATEAGTFCNFIINHHTNIDSSIVPIGYAVKDMEVLILDENGVQVEDGGIGEIALRSEYLALGYWQQPELTQTLFLPDANHVRQRIYRTGDLGCVQPNGCLVHKGRKDFQVKIRGFRIEVAEIEIELLKISNIKEAVVIATEDNTENKRLIAYLVTKQKPAPDFRDMREYLRHKLPEYMLPSAFIFLDALPLTPNGKLNRKELSQLILFHSDRGCVMPRDDIEVRLIKIWEDLLGIKPIGIQDDFFELGGNSLLAVRLFLEIERNFGQKLPLAVLLSSATVESLALIIAQEGVLINSRRINWSSLVKIQPQGKKPPLFMIHPMGGEVLCYRNLATHMGLEQPIYGLQPQGLDGKQPPLVRVEDMAAQYLEEIRAFQPQGPYFLGGFSFGGIIAYEMAQQLHRQGQKVAFLALLDTCRPGYQYRLSFLKRIFLHLNYIHQGGLKYFFGKSKGWFKHAHYLLKRSYKDYEQVFKDLTDKFDQYHPKQYLDIYNTNNQAMNQYVFQPYAGKVTLFRTRDEYRSEAVGIKYDEAFGWDNIINDLDIQYIPGSHFSLLDEPYVRILAQELESRLEDVQLK